MPGKHVDSVRVSFFFYSGYITDCFTVWLKRQSVILGPHSPVRFFDTCLETQSSLIMDLYRSQIAVHFGTRGHYHKTS